MAIILFAGCQSTEAVTNRWLLAIQQKLNGGNKYVEDKLQTSELVWRQEEIALRSRLRWDYMTLKSEGISPLLTFYIFFMFFIKISIIFLTFPWWQSKVSRTETFHFWLAHYKSLYLFSVNSDIYGGAGQTRNKFVSLIFSQLKYQIERDPCNAMAL
jgi:hypothetical protein